MQELNAERASVCMTLQSSQVTTLKSISSVHTVSVCFLHIRLWLLHSDAIGILLD